MDFGSEVFESKSALRVVLVAGEAIADPIVAGNCAPFRVMIHDEVDC